jgi:succinate dehydrogenase/fumarate reductase flavoprotein subunit
MGGLFVNEKAETGIPGLYAAGDVASVHKQHLSGAFVFGEVAAEEAVEFIRSNPVVKLNDRQVGKVEDLRNRRFTAAGRDIDVRELEYKVRRLIGDYVVSPKNEYKLNRWLEWSDRFGFEIKDRVAVRNGHELSKLYEVDHIVRCADYSALASLERRESRWGDAHHRVDYPDRDDQNWRCHVMVHRGDAPDDIQLSTKPVTDSDRKEVRA